MNRGAAVRQMEKKIFYGGVTCPCCNRKLTTVKTGRHVTVPDAKSMVDHGTCVECHKKG